jgi:hypothetical protein
MRKRLIGTLLLFALGSCVTAALAETVDVRLRIRQTKSEEMTITRENLVKIKQFILEQGGRETYCSMYSNNPAQHTKDYSFYLNPDSGQENVNCDTEKSDFHNLTIRESAGGKNQYRTVEFLDEHYVYITANRPTNDLTVEQIRQFVVDAMKEILAEIEKKEPDKPDAGDGR